MESLTNNDEQTLRGAGDEARLPTEEIADPEVANRKEFFQEADEVRAAIQRVVTPDLETRACREACERVGAIWTLYQEQPGLLDPFMEEMVLPLIGAISTAVHQNSRAAQGAMQNLHLISSLLYILTTVRGYKTVVRFFPHEAADLEPCLEAAEAELQSHDGSTWSTLYCLTLWLGMVLLTPFDLKSIDSGGEKGLSTRIYELGLAGLRSTSRTRDASAWMLAKFFTRPDVTGAGSLQSFFQWTRDAWSENAEGGIATLVFMRCGALQAWNQTLKSAPRSVLKAIWVELLELLIRGPAGQADQDFKASSAMRKLRVAAACRAGLVALPPRLASWRYERGARSLLVNFSEATGGIPGDCQMFAGGGAASFEPPNRPAAANVGPQATAVPAAGAEEEEDEADEDVPELVEEVIELMLASLSDSDTVVRWAAAKGVGRVTNRLSRDFGDQVLESLLERCFSFRETDRAWHGGCLALAELTRRGLLLPDRLPTVVPLVCQALHFEQVSGNHAVGSHVRDAACYVCWAFGRAYAPEVLAPFVTEIASALIQVAVYDREINCRRAAAAAVQEHVGRQGTFPNGIDVVTIADYWTLSARRHAYLVVAPELAALGEGTYRQDLITHLVERKLAHQDLQIRLLAGQGLAKLAENATESIAAHLNEVVFTKLLACALAAEGASGGGAAAAPSVAGSGPTLGTVQSRHGAVIGVSALVDALQDRVSVANQTAVRNLVPGLEKIRAYRGRGGEVIRQAACHLLASVAAATTWTFKDATGARYLQTVDECARHTTDSIQVAAADALRVLAVKRFKPELCVKCMEANIAGLGKPTETIAARRGFVLCLGALPSAALGERCSEVVAALAKEIKGNELPGGKEQEDPQTRQYAVLSLGRIALDLPVAGQDLEVVTEALETAMKDYATDRRGDVGSWVREAAMEVISGLLEAQFVGAAPRLPEPATSTRLVALLLQQAAEKLDRIRERAFGLLCRLLCRRGVVAPASCVELAYRRVCHGESYIATEAATKEAPDLFSVPPASEKPGSVQAWPPDGADRLQRALNDAGEIAIVSAESTDERLAIDRSAAIFDALVPMLSCAAYRPALTLGFVVSVGCITEYTAKGAKKALLRFLQESPEEGEAPRGNAICSEMLHIFDVVGVRDAEPEAKRVLAPLLTTVGVLLAQGFFPEELAPDALERATAAVKTSRDITRLRSSIPVFVGLMRWPGAVRRKALGVLLQFLGFSFPVVRQATAQAFYIRLLEESGDFDLSDGSGAGEKPIPETVVAEVLELVTVTPWSTDNEEALSAALREVYAKLGFELPTGGRSMLAPRKPKEDKKPKEAEYADLVREFHY